MAYAEAGIWGRGKNGEGGAREGKAQQNQGRGDLAGERGREESEAAAFADLGKAVEEQLKAARLAEVGGYEASPSLRVALTEMAAGWPREGVAVRVLSPAAVLAENLLAAWPSELSPEEGVRLLSRDIEASLRPFIVRDKADFVEVILADRGDAFDEGGAVLVYDLALGEKRPVWAVERAPELALWVGITPVERADFDAEEAKREPEKILEALQNGLRDFARMMALAQADAALSMEAQTAILGLARQGRALQGALAVARKVSAAVALPKIDKQVAALRASLARESARGDLPPVLRAVLRRSLAVLTKAQGRGALPLRRVARTPVQRMAIVAQAARRGTMAVLRQAVTAVAGKSLGRGATPVVGRGMAQQGRIQQRGMQQGRTSQAETQRGAFRETRREERQERGTAAVVAGALRRVGLAGGAAREAGKSREAALVAGPRARAGMAAVVESGVRGQVQEAFRGAVQEMARGGMERVERKAGLGKGVAVRAAAMVVEAVKAERAVTGGSDGVRLLNGAVKGTDVAVRVVSGGEARMPRGETGVGGKESRVVVMSDAVQRGAVGRDAVLGTVLAMEGGRAEEGERAVGPSALRGVAVEVEGKQETGKQETGKQEAGRDAAVEGRGEVSAAVKNLYEGLSEEKSERPLPPCGCADCSGGKGSGAGGGGGASPSGVGKVVGARVASGGGAVSNRVRAVRRPPSPK